MVERIGAKDLPLLERFGRQGRDRDGRVLKIFRDAAGGDDDFVEYAGFCLLGEGLDWCEGKGDRKGEQGSRALQ
jgi:hypothetical protein